MPSLLRLATLVLLVAAAPVPARAATVHVRCDASDPRGSLFPSDRFTVRDASQVTGRRVALPKPSCAERPSECQDIDVINTLDGFNVQPRLSIPFDGPIDVTSVTSGSVFLLRLSVGRIGAGLAWPGPVIGLNQVVWEPARLTLHAEADELLEPDTRYALVVTSGIRDTAGDPVGGCGLFAGPAVSSDAEADARALRHSPVWPKVVAATVFSTQSTTTTLEKIRAQIQATTPAPADFVLEASGGRAVFAASDVASIVFQRQVGATVFVPSLVPTVALSTVPGSVGTIAFGRYRSPDYQTAGGVIPAVPSRTGVPAVQRVQDVHFTLFLPSRPQPPSGWPVAIFGHGLGDNKNNSPFVVASILADQGIATVAINIVGHGGGPAGTLDVTLSTGAVVKVPAGGRAVDQNRDGLFDVMEGSLALPPATIVTNRDALRQTVADLLQLVRQIQSGMDVDGDARSDFDPARVSYLGQSFGGIYGTLFLALEPSVRTGVLNVAGGSIIDVVRLGSFRPLLTQILALRTPSLLNAPGGFNENLPLRDQPPLVDTVGGAAFIQEVLERFEWVSTAANPAAYARHLRLAPLRGARAKSVLLQFAKGDQTVPNPTNTAIVRAGRLADRTTFFRNDLAYAANPTGVPKNPHSFLTRLNVPAVAAFAVAAQVQASAFLATDGAVTLDPDGVEALFEVPIVPPLPETLSFIP